MNTNSRNHFVSDTENDYLRYNMDRLTELFVTALGDEGKDWAAILAERYGSLEYIFSTAYDELESLVGKRCATFIKVLAAVTSRRVTDSLVIGETYTMADIADYFCALLMPLEVETVYAMLVSEDSRVLAVKKISEGTVNASEVQVRKIVEVAIDVGAKGVVLAHNHPHGTSEPSKDDNVLTRCVAETLSYAGLRLEYSLIVAGRECSAISSRELEDEQEGFYNA